MKQLLNTLYVMTQGAYVSLDHETVKVEAEGRVQMQVPLHHLGGIVTMGNVMLSPFLLGRCAVDSKAVVLLDRNGQFMCRIVGKVSGNVLLRQAQYEHARESDRAVVIARNIVAGKVRNSRTSLLRSAREAEDAVDENDLRSAAAVLEETLSRLQHTVDIDQVRGLEGESASEYFRVFDRMVRSSFRAVFKFAERSRRPPLDPANALLSFLYTILLNDCVSAVEGVGLDSQMGFLHALRPGRPSLGLDLMEEFRPLLADRVALTLINRGQVTADDFEVRLGGATWLNDKGRKTVITEYQKRKQDELHHSLLKEKVSLGIMPHIQARLLARHLRGDTDAYTPFIYA